MFQIKADEWVQAKSFFQANPDKNKFIPSVVSLYYFINTDKGIFALARKKFREPYILGKGVYSIVVKAQNEQNHIVACKLFYSEIKIPDDESVSVMQHLRLLLGQMDRPKKSEKEVTIAGKKFRVKKKGYQILPLAKGLTLFSILDKIQKQTMPPLSELQKDIICLKLCFALLAYHQKNVIHGDLTAKNIIIDLEEDINVTLVDQGFSVLLAEGENQRTLSRMRGTADFMAPELVDARVCSYKTDIFALGKIFALLGRQTWSDFLMSFAPTHRASLHEILLLIWEKIGRINHPLTLSVREKMERTIEVTLTEYQNNILNGLPLASLIRTSIYSQLFKKNEVLLLALHIAAAYFNASKEKLKSSLLTEHDFLVKVNQQREISITFIHSFIDIDAICLAYEEEKIPPEKREILRLVKILASLGISIKAENSLPELVNSLHILVKSQIPEEYQREVMKCRNISTGLEESLAKTHIKTDSDEEEPSSGEEEIERSKYRP